MSLVLFGDPDRGIESVARRIANELQVPFSMVLFGQDLAAHLRDQPADVLVIAADSPGPEHYHLCKQITDQRRALNVYIVGQPPSTQDLQRCTLEAGGAAYIGERDPHLLELSIRQAFHLRMSPSRMHDLGRGCVFDASLRLISRAGARAQLTEQESRVLECLLSREGRLVTYSELSRAVWGGAVEMDRHNMYQPIYSLRVHLQAYGLGECLVTVRNQGYCYVKPGDDETRGAGQGL